MSLSVNGERIDLSKRFPDGTYRLKLKKTPTNATITWKYEGEHEFVALIYIAMHLRDHGCMVLRLNMPYVPNARMDRVQSTDEVFTLKYFSDIINGLGFDTVSVMDPHSHVSSALIDRVEIKYPLNQVFAAMQSVERLENGEVPLLFYPDEGAMKRYSSMFSAPYAFGIKQRDWETGEITGLEIHGEDPKGKVILIVDDICSKGGTFYYSAVALKNAGAAGIYLYITHCENTIFEGKLLEGDLIKRIYTTSSILSRKHEKIAVISD